MNIKKIHWAHLTAVIILVGYFLLSKIMIVYALSLKNLFYSFLALYLFGAFFGVCLLNILSHKKFFFIGREIEKEEMKKEKRLLNKHLHHGKIAATFDSSRRLWWADRWR